MFAKLLYFIPFISYRKKIDTFRICELSGSHSINGMFITFITTHLSFGMEPSFFVNFNMNSPDLSILFIFCNYPSFVSHTISNFFFYIPLVRLVISHNVYVVYELSMTQSIENWPQKTPGLQDIGFIFLKNLYVQKCMTVPDHDDQYQSKKILTDNIIMETWSRSQFLDIL